MPVSLANTRDTTAAALICMVGALLVPIMPIIGFPMCAAALASLVYRGRRTTAATIAVIAVVVVGLLRLSDVAILAPGLVAVLLATAGLREHGALNITIMLVPVLAVSFAMAELASAWLSGMSYRDYVAEIATLMEPAMMQLSQAGTATGESLVDLVVRFAPSGYFVMAVVTVVPTMIAIGWAAGRSETKINRLPRLAVLDLSPHVLWLPIFALVAMAAGRLLGQPEGVISTVGLNLLFAARIVLFVQGLGVLASWLDTLGVGRAARVVAYVAAFAIDATTWVVSLIGLVDFWANLRKLERSGETRSEQSSER